MRLKSRRLHGPLVPSEVRMVGPGGQDEIIVWKSQRAGDDLPRLKIEAFDSAKDDAHIGSAGKNAADGPGDIGGGKCGRRHLIEQRLEQVIIALVDERHIDRLVRKAFRGRKPSKSRAHNHGFRPCPGVLTCIIMFLRGHLSLLSSLRHALQEKDRQCRHTNTINVDLFSSNS